jgi:hypothetical protein
VFLLVTLSFHVNRHYPLPRCWVMRHGCRGLDWLARTTYILLAASGSSISVANQDPCCQHGTYDSRRRDNGLQRRLDSSIKFKFKPKDLEIVCFVLSFAYLLSWDCTCHNFSGRPQFGWTPCNISSNFPSDQCDRLYRIPEHELFT